MTAPRFTSFARIVGFAAASLLAAGLLTSCAPEPGPDPSTPEPSGKPSPTPDAESPAPETSAPDANAFDKTAYSIDDSDSIWVVVNKLRPLNPQSYAPTDLVVPNVASTNGQPLRAVAATATEEMVAAAAADGVALHIVSAYRDYDTQVSVYGSFVANQGQAYADTTSARPGHSEHQTGLTADFGGDDDCTLDTCFAGTAAGTWLQKRAAEFGFTMRYPDGAEGTTGYHFEPWHYRYVGVELAQELRAQDVATLEEFFGLQAAPDYAG